MNDEPRDEEFEADDVESEQSDSEEEEMETEESAPQEPPVRRTYIPNSVNNDEELEFDESAYILYRKVETEYPCLSFDIIADNLGSERSENYPMTVHMVAGTQSGKADGNKILVLRMSNLNRIKHKEDKDKESDEESSDSEDEDEDNAPKLDFVPIDHKGCVNRVRSTSVNGKCLCATWSEIGTVFLWNLNQAVDAFNDSELMNQLTRNKSSIKPIFNFRGHREEGYGLDWSPTKEGMLATGDCRKDIFIWKPNDAGSWNVDQKPLIGHKESVEDLQWSPSEENVLASCSVDKSIRVWDIRAKPSSSCMLSVESAHESDINVISWNRCEKSFICSGGDDGVIKIWDLRHFKSKTPKPIATFKHHISHITSVEWHPTDGTVFAASGDDNQLTLWDLAVEKDSETNEPEDQPEVNQLPPQLLFIHQGQTEIKRSSLAPTDTRTSGEHCFQWYRSFSNHKRITLGLRNWNAVRVSLKDD